MTRALLGLAALASIITATSRPANAQPHLPCTSIAFLLPTLEQPNDATQECIPQFTTLNPFSNYLTQLIENLEGETPSPSTQFLYISEISMTVRDFITATASHCQDFMPHYPEFAALLDRVHSFNNTTNPEGIAAREQNWSRLEQAYLPLRHRYHECIAPSSEKKGKEKRHYHLFESVAHA